MSGSFAPYVRIAVGLLGLTIPGSCLEGCAVNNDVPPRAGPIGRPTNPPAPRLEGHTQPPNPEK